MLLGLHNYSYYLHGLGGRWKGFKPAWPTQMDVFGLIQRTVELGLDGLHLDAAAIGPTDEAHLAEVRRSVSDRGLFLEFNWGLPKPGADPRLQFSLERGLEITRSLGADLGKLSLNLTRPKPIMASRHHPQVIAQLESIAAMIREVQPFLEQHQIRLALENHTDCFASEILWLLERIKHPLVGACLDTINPLMVGEDPMQAIRDLAPRSFTNHFRDSKIVQTRYGCRIVGCALGEGDLDLVEAYEHINNSPGMDRLNIEIALDAPADDQALALEMEEQAIRQSIAYCRERLMKGKV